MLDGGCLWMLKWSWMMMIISKSVVDCVYVDIPNTVLDMRIINCMSGE